MAVKSHYNHFAPPPPVSFSPYKPIFFKESLDIFHPFGVHCGEKWENVGILDPLKLSITIFEFWGILYA